MFSLQVWCAFHGHGTAYIIIGCFNFILGEPQCFQQVPFEVEILLGVESQTLQALFPERVNIEYESDFKG